MVRSEKPSRSLPFVIEQRTPRDFRGVSVEKMLAPIAGSMRGTHAGVCRSAGNIGNFKCNESSYSSPRCDCRACTLIWRPNDVVELILHEQCSNPEAVSSYEDYCLAIATKIFDSLASSDVLVLLTIISCIGFRSLDPLSVRTARHL